MRGNFRWPLPGWPFKPVIPQFSTISTLQTIRTKSLTQLYILTTPTRLVDGNMGLGRTLLTRVLENREQMTGATGRLQRS